MPIMNLMELGNKQSCEVEPPVLEKILGQYQNIVGMVAECSVDEQKREIGIQLSANFSQGRLVSLCGVGKLSLDYSQNISVDYFPKINVTPSRFSSGLIHEFKGNIATEDWSFSLVPTYDDKTGKIVSLEQNSFYRSKVQILRNESKRLSRKYRVSDQYVAHFDDANFQLFSKFKVEYRSS